MNAKGLQNLFSAVKRDPVLETRPMFILRILCGLIIFAMVILLVEDIKACEVKVQEQGFFIGGNLQIDLFEEGAGFFYKRNVAEIKGGFKWSNGLRIQLTHESNTQVKDTGENTVGFGYEITF